MHGQVSKWVQRLLSKRRKVFGGGGEKSGTSKIICESAGIHLEEAVGF